MIISVHITQAPEKGEKAWAYSVQIDGKIHKIGYGHHFDSATKLAKAGVQSALKYIKSLDIAPPI